MPEKKGTEERKKRDEKNGKEEKKGKKGKKSLTELAKENLCSECGMTGHFTRNCAKQSQKRKSPSQLGGSGQHEQPQTPVAEPSSQLGDSNQHEDSPAPGAKPPSQFGGSGQHEHPQAHLDPSPFNDQSQHSTHQLPTNVAPNQPSSQGQQAGFSESAGIPGGSRGKRIIESEFDAVKGPWGYGEVEMVLR